MAGAATESAPAPTPALGVAPPLTPRSGLPRRRLPAGAAAAPGRRLGLAGAAVAAALCAISFYATGGLNLETMTATEMALTIGSGLVLAFAALTLRGGLPAYGLWPVLLLGAFAALSALSIVWSVQPDVSWRDTDRLLAFGAVFAAAAVTARMAPRAWPALIGGVTLAAVAVCGWALLGKSLPGQFPEADHYARLYEPYGYWNALGLTAAMGAIGCMWLGARRSGHALLSALAYPAMGVVLTALLLAYSRGALVALVVGLVLWFALVPLRLRSAAVLLAGGVAAGAIAAWDFSTHSLTTDGLPAAESSSAAHELGALLIAMVVLLSVVGVAVVFGTSRRAPAPVLRRRAGIGLLALLAVALVAFAGALAISHRGFTGTISHAFNSLTDTHAKVPNTPGRLTAIASVRAQYWNEALKVFQAHPVAGAGAGGYEVARLRYRSGPLPVKHAHGFIVQTLADLGIVGLVLVLALLASWMAAAGRATHPFNRRWPSWAEIRAGARPRWAPLPRLEGRYYGPERIGMLSLLCIVVVFGIHSLIDWTWYVPGDAVVALICAGWLAGRGPLTAGKRSAVQLPAGRPSPVRLALAAAAIVGALLIAWTQWQPQRSSTASLDALAKLEGNRSAAMAAARAGVSRDPLSAEALFTLASVQSGSGQAAQARATLRKAVRVQPSNPKTWLTLGHFDLAADPHAALEELRAGIYLNPELVSQEALTHGEPEAVQAYNDYIQALRGDQAAAALRSASEQRSRAASGAPRAGHRRRAPKPARSRTRK